MLALNMVLQKRHGIGGGPSGSRPGGLRFQERTGLKHLAGLLDRRLRDKGTAIAFDGDQTAMGQCAQGLAHNRAASPKNLADLILVELHARQYAVLVHGLGQLRHDGVGCGRPGRDVGGSGHGVLVLRRRHFARKLGENPRRVRLGLYTIAARFLHNAPSGCAAWEQPAAAIATENDKPFGFAHRPTTVRATLAGGFACALISISNLSMSQSVMARR